eukprot:12715600-Alexandrium_andersonii.AAC.1
MWPSPSTWPPGPGCVRSSRVRPTSTRGSSAGTSSRLPCCSSGRPLSSRCRCAPSSSVVTPRLTAQAPGAPSTPPMSA